MIITYIPKIHQNNTCNWHATTKEWNGWEALSLQITFPYIFTVKERYNPLDYFRMGIIEEIS